MSEPRLGYEFMPIDCRRYSTDAPNFHIPHFPALKPAWELDGDWDAPPDEIHECVHLLQTVAAHYSVVPPYDFAWSFAYCEHGAEPILILGPIYEH